MHAAKDHMQEMEKELKRLNNEKREAETNALMAKSQLTTYKQNMEQQSAEREKSVLLLVHQKQE